MNRYFCLKVSTQNQWRIHDLPKGTDQGKRTVRACNGGPRWSPQWGPWAESLVGAKGVPEAESFLYIFVKKTGQKLRI